MKNTLIKKTLCILLLSALLTASAGAETVVTSFYPIQLLALNLLHGAEGVELVNLAAPGTGCLHDYQLNTGDMKALARADVFLINGAGMESYLDHVMQNLPDLPIVDASAGVELLEDVSGEMEYNAHIWLDAGNAIRMAENLSAGLIEALPEQAELIAANRDALAARLAALDTELREGIAGLPRRDIVTFHEAFPYFARAYGLEVAAVVVLEPGDSLSPRQLAELVDTVTRLGNPPLFTEPQYESLAAETIAAETGAPIYELDPCVTGPSEDIPLTYYEDVMRRNLQVLQEALQ